LGPQGKGPNPDVVSRLVGGERPSNAYRTLLRDRDYRYWFSSTLISSLGDWAGIVALPILVSALTPSGSRLALFALGGVMMVRLLPNILFGPLGGVLADRYDRKRLMVVTDLVRGALFLGIAFSRDLVALLALTFIVECMSLLFVSAKDASLPLIVDKEHLTEANQLNVLVTYGSLPLGAALASVATGVSGLMGGRGAIFTATLVLFFNAVSFLLAAALIAQLRLPPHGRRSAAHDDSPGFLQELVEGLKFINDLPMVRSLILGVVGVFFGAGVVVGLGPEFVRTALGRSEDDFTLLMTAVGGGLVLGIAAVGWISKRIRKERLFPVSLAATAASATVMATLPSFTAVLATSVVLGAAAGMSFVMGYTLLQEYTRDEVRSRTFATFYTATRLALFASLGLAPFVAGSIGRFAVSIGDFSYTMSGLRISIVLGGLVALLAALSAGNGMYRALRDMEARAARWRCRRWRRRRTSAACSCASKASRAPASPRRCGRWRPCSRRRATRSSPPGSPEDRSWPSASASCCSTPTPSASTTVPRPCCTPRRGPTTSPRSSAHPSHRERWCSATVTWIPRWLTRVERGASARITSCRSAAGPPAVCCRTRRCCCAWIPRRACAASSNGRAAPRTPGARSPRASRMTRAPSGTAWNGRTRSSTARSPRRSLTWRDGAATASSWWTPAAASTR